MHPKNSASITRASQPNAGLVGKTRNKDDEKYFQVKDVSSLVNSSSMISFKIRIPLSRKVKVHTLVFDNEYSCVQTISSLHADSMHNTVCEKMELIAGCQLISLAKGELTRTCKSGLNFKQSFPVTLEE